jgi:AcrR family transcriptional regulator
MASGSRREEILRAAAKMFATSGVRTSLKDVATECGMLPGSLYFHFDSKDALIIELIERYQEDLDQVAKEALQAPQRADPSQVLDRVVGLGKAIAACAERHFAALLLTLYDPPAGASDELRRVVRATPNAINTAMLHVLRSGGDDGAFRAGVDLRLLADRLCESMLRHGLTSPYLGSDAEHLVELRCQILLLGLAPQPVSTRSLDRSDALRAVKAVVASWSRDVDADERVTHLREVARAEFGRHGYEATTLRSIAMTAGLSTSTVYRFFPAKDQLLASIMDSYAQKRQSAWNAVLASKSTEVEKLDALAWLYIVLLERFGHEFRIQLGTVRHAPRSILGTVPTSNYADIEALLRSGAEAGEITIPGDDARACARCVHEALWTPEDIVRVEGSRAAHGLARATLLSGALAGVEPNIRLG